MIDNELLERNIKAMKSDNDCGRVSDGDHTFAELYHHRTVLFAALCNANKEIAWKSKLHDDGTMFDGYFVAGINTPTGQATYHQELLYWDAFDVPELEKAPPFDGHTPDVAISRLSLEFCGGKA